MIVTPCCGEVVTDGVNGRLVPARDADALAQAIRDGLEDRAILEAQGAAAVLTASEFSLGRLGQHLGEIERDVAAGNGMETTSL